MYYLQIECIICVCMFENTLRDQKRLMYTRCGIIVKCVTDVYIPPCSSWMYFSKKPRTLSYVIVYFNIEIVLEPNNNNHTYPEEPRIVRILDILNLIPPLHVQ